MAIVESKLTVYNKARDCHFNSGTYRHFVQHFTSVDSGKF